MVGLYLRYGEWARGSKEKEGEEVGEAGEEDPIDLMLPSDRYRWSYEDREPLIVLGAIHSQDSQLPRPAKHQQIIMPISVNSKNPHRKQFQLLITGVISADCTVSWLLLEYRPIWLPNSFLTFLHEIAFMNLMMDSTDTFSSASDLGIFAYLRGGCECFNHNNLIEIRSDLVSDSNIVTVNHHFHAMTLS